MIIKLFLQFLQNSTSYSLRCLNLLTKGQIPKYEILQLAHRLEKGLLVKKNKTLVGLGKGI